MTGHGQRKDWRGTITERFWQKVNKTDTCWLWTGQLNHKGYGLLHVSYGKTARAHRFAWELLRGPIPDGYVIDHDHPEFGCHNPACVNPDHLQAAPNRINIQRRRGLQSNCTSGERGVCQQTRKGLWRGEVKYTDADGVQRKLKKTSKDRAVVSAWVLEMRAKYHN